MVASIGGLKVPSPVSSSSRSSLAPSQSLRSQRSQRSQAHSTIRTVVTSPPWARDEPPSPSDDPDDYAACRQSDCRPSDVGSYQSSARPGSVHESRWWTFTRPRAAGPSQYMDPGESSTQGAEKTEKKGSLFRDRSMSWLPAHHRRPLDNSPPTKGFKGHRSTREEHQGDWALTIDLPPPPTASFTMAHSRTPGWDIPWTARATQEGPTQAQEFFGSEENHEESSRWAARKKRLRMFVLTNSYVPLLFRFVNITFTTAALVVAIRIRMNELGYHVMGAVGSSPMLVIIFAPLTLVHVMVAIYLEYFGRPLGLWHTSSKLTHTLLEVLFICAWSAALSLCFDNYFTSLIPCAPSSSIAWYNQIPRTIDPDFPNLGRHQGGVGDRICDDQLVLIILVGIGLIMYCMNLIISLFRIFQKVKDHPGARLTMGA